MSQKIWFLGLEVNLISLMPLASSNLSEPKPSHLLNGANTYPFLFTV